MSLRAARRGRHRDRAALARRALLRRRHPAQVHDVLHELGVEHAAVSIVDEGALPFVIAARIEAAVRRAGVATTSRRCRKRSPLPPPSARDRLRRSRLYLPGNEPKYFINAGCTRPTRSFSTWKIRSTSRRRMRRACWCAMRLRAVDFGAAERMVRINQLPLGYGDLEEIVPQSPDLILIPKVENAGTGRVKRRRPSNRCGSAQELDAARSG